MKRKKEVTARKIYSHAFKMQVVQEYDNGQIFKRGLSIKYQINPSTVDRWLENHNIFILSKLIWTLIDWFGKYDRKTFLPAHFLQLSAAFVFYLTNFVNKVG